MPELPEVENIGRALKKLLTGRKICKVELFTPAMRTPLTPLLEADLTGAQILDVRRRGRYLTAELTKCRAFLMHFGMSGVVRVEGADVPKRKHEHIFIHLDDGNIFRFECTRRFSIFELHELSPGKLFPDVLDKLGVEPLEDDFTAAYLHSKAAKVRGCVKNFIMDNAVVVGIGNIYATETLFLSGIDPRRSASTLTLPECRKIVKHARKTLICAIESGGTTISDFLNVDGSEGAFASSLQVYGRSGKECFKCGTLIESVKLGGRTSAFCPGCQK
jgi:formamidopyrimidine-DNA glycosylase